MMQNSQKASQEKVIAPSYAGIPERQCVAKRLRMKEAANPSRHRSQVLSLQQSARKLPGQPKPSLCALLAQWRKQLRSSEQNGIRIPIANYDITASCYRLERHDTTAAKRINDEFSALAIAQHKRARHGSFHSSDVWRDLMERPICARCRCRGPYPAGELPFSG